MDVEPERELDGGRRVVDVVRPAVAQLAARLEAPAAGDADARAPAESRVDRATGVVGELVDPGAGHGVERLADPQRGTHEVAAVARDAVGEARERPRPG